MASFKHKTNGVILTTDNKTVIEQLKKNPDYKEVKKSGKPPAPEQSEDKTENNPEDNAEDNTEDNTGAEEQ